MRKAKEDLKAVMDLLANVREENGFPSIHVSIHSDGSGFAYSIDSDDDSLDCIVHGDYGTVKEKEPAGSNRTGSDT